MLWFRAQLRPAYLYPWARYLISICFIDQSASDSSNWLWEILQSAKVLIGRALGQLQNRFGWNEMIVTISWRGNYIGKKKGAIQTQNSVNIIIIPL